jgi:hypothetical protein
MFGRQVPAFLRKLYTNLHTLYPRRGSQDSSVSIATGYGLDGRGVGVQVPVGSRIFSMSSRVALGSTNLLSNGYRDSCPMDKAAGA